MSMSETLGDVVDSSEDHQSQFPCKGMIQTPWADAVHDDVSVLSDGDAQKILPYEADDSPYPEVRAVVQPVDDVSLSLNTMRMWVIGVIFTIVGSGLNQFFSLRQPSVTISALVAQLVAYPIGCAWARWMPIGLLNPNHHFNIKEHALITIMANVSFGSAAATQIIEATVKFYGMPSRGGFEVLLTVTTQLLGFGLAGMASRWLVVPATMIWPGVLSNAALLSTLHSQTNLLADGWIITRLRFFLVVFIAGAVWYFVPGYLFTALSFFSFVCWIVPHNVVVNQLFGQRTGLGMSLLTFDWAQVVFANQSPLLVPFWAGLNVMGSFVLFYWIICPIIYYTNTWYSAYMPLMNSNTFDNTGYPYRTMKVMRSDGTVDVEAYKNYSPMFLPAGYALTYGIAFANLTGIFFHVALYNGKDLWEQWKGRNQKDVHARLIAAYKAVPWWWFAVITIIIFALSIVTNEVWETGLSAWAVVVAFILPAIYFIPVGIIKATTNISSNQLNLITEFIGGYAFLGRPVANMAFKFYGYVAVSQGLEFVADMKLAHYLHIAPRTLFMAQGVATLIGAVVQCGVTVFMLTRFDDICTPDADGGFTCPHGQVTYSSSLIWGGLGPGRNFSPGQIYGNLLWFFLAGPVVIVITYLLGRRWKWLNKISWPVAFGAMSLVPPATGINFSSWWVVNMIFNGIIKRRKPAWWSKYNYVLSAALDSGVAVATVVIFFCIILPAGPLHWWGNEVFLETADSKGTPWKPLPESGYFGPAKGTWE
ncbi:small oligopeptide transporter, OPT family [Aspergillus clavatus NRRL 1]|uniref:Small oligopeptide transporter, OPT family n=1 Tax=Aspergillus clavatus (strain ATCC 1007 / CBS 513.65 / DSM 816 / NCTC 3887 / NRRL 1 / QM 1276 / 107) TaxID=344612 RepID=A1CTR3_ASPCL|nr:small oligopeptide transporter, OPT family [Aspergillus clavatus NRRL 1]EAW06700.1 small oligopeptide transporter, OPT family [Aspergillus clavatus NRRL 1]